MFLSSTLRRFRHDLVPPAGNERRYAFAIFLDSIGDGLFHTGSVVFALAAIGLSAQQVGIAMSAAGVAGFIAASTLGTVADRFGARRTLTVLCLLEVCFTLLYTVSGSFAMFTVVACLVATCEFGKGPASSALASAITTGERRVRLRAQTRSLHNLAFTLGAALAGLALAIGTMPAYYALPVCDAAMVLAEVIAVRRLPEVRSVVEAATRRTFAALRNVPFLTVTALNGVLGLYGTLIVVVVPLWIVGPVAAPAPLISALLMLNTFLVVLFQVRASKGSESLPGSVRNARRAAAVLFAACVIMGLSSGLPTVPAVLLVVVGVVLLSVGEMVHSGSEWGLAYELAPRQAQAEYLAGLEMSMAGQSIVGPAFGTWLVLTFGLAGWTALGVLFVLAAILIGPVARWTAATLARMYPPPAEPPEPGELPRAA
jgi:MFS family permease